MKKLQQLSLSFIGIIFCVPLLAVEGNKSPTVAAPAGTTIIINNGGGSTNQLKDKNTNTDADKNNVNNNKPNQPQNNNESKKTNTTNTARRFSAGVIIAAGSGLKTHKVETRGSHADYQISAGGGLGFGIRGSYGLSKMIDLDTSFVSQESKMEHYGGTSLYASTGSGSFKRQVFLFTGKYKMPLSYNKVMKFGGGLGMYMNGKLSMSESSTNFKKGDLAYNKLDVEYKDAIGYHLTGEYEHIFKPNLSWIVGAKLYFVDYEPDNIKVEKVDYVVDDTKTFDGSGFDIIAGFNFYF
ncbi:MAG: hypothetical protein DRQ51_00425 [Gammaproteobacteria bacterium]|nr:MAG: hypothetical protein DRQ51_00425 [Gammaproteobacteria bacterium]